MTENFFPRLPALPNERAAAQTFVHKLFRPLDTMPFWAKKPALIGVAGTVTTLAMLAKGMTDYDAERIDGTILASDTVEKLSDMLFSLSHAELHALPGVEQGRADVLPAGSLLLKLFMRQFGFSSVIASVRGLRYGIAVREYLKTVKG